ncbi:MAG: hypothetical protein AAGJ18_04590 [Bacteroidota bacterium]
MKKQLTLCLIPLFFTSIITAQNKHDVGFTQRVDIKAYTGANFKVEAAVKLSATMDVADIAIWARVHKKDHSIAFFDNTIEHSPKKDTWEAHTIEGIFDETADYLMIGGYCAYNGLFYFDDFKLSVQQDGAWKDVPLKNGSFENTNFEKVTYDGKTYDKKMIQGWEGFIVMEDRATFTPVSTSEEVHAGKYALLVKGEGYFYAPTILRKYVGIWDVEFVPELSENAWSGSMKGVIEHELVGGGYILQGPLYSRQVFDKEEKISKSYSYISYHPALEKVYETELGDDAPPIISEGVLKENGNLEFKPITIAGNNALNRTFRYTWLSEDEFSITQEFDGNAGARVKAYYRVTRQK